MKPIFLTRGYIALVSDEDYEAISKYNWHVMTGTHGSVYAARQTGENNVRRRILMHKQIMGDTPPGLEIDHADGYGLNNQRSNLRLATRQQNMWNRTKRIAGTSKYLGVSRIARDNVWAMHITHNKRRVQRFFQSEIEAARAYDELAYGLRGEFAKLNFPHAPSPPTDTAA